jgi:hypothetical protein
MGGCLGLVVDWISQGSAEGGSAEALVVKFFRLKKGGEVRDVRDVRRHTESQTESHGRGERRQLGGGRQPASMTKEFKLSLPRRTV